MMATYNVRQRADAGDNLIITHEPTFYGHMDQSAALVNEKGAVLAAKAFIEKHHLVIWRFHDLWHARTPGMIRARLGEVPESDRWESGRYAPWVVTQPCA